jgi:SAM-dependent methyltransferase
MRSAGALPIPPPDLAARVGTVAGADPVQFYLDEGRRVRERIDAVLPADWDWTGKVVLDFGCGSARVLRHYADEAARARLMGCDIDHPSVDWASRELSPPFEFFHSAPAPPLALESDSLDLIWATSVFTHISDLWAAWLAEMHRLLAPAGLLVATYLGEGIWDSLVGEPYAEDQVGMTVLHHWEGPDAWVFHSEWWLREHWGRAFDVLAVQRPNRDAAGAPQVTHSYLLLRKRPVEVTAALLERLEPGDERELAGLQTGLRLARRELTELALRTHAPSQRPLRDALLQTRLGPPLRKLRAAARDRS